MKYLLILVLFSLASCYKKEPVETSGPVKLTADVRMYSYFTLDGKINYYWYSFVYESRTIPAKATVTIEWDNFDAAGNFIKKETFKSTIETGQANPAVQQTLAKTSPGQTAKNIRILDAQCDNLAIKFSY